MTKISNLKICPRCKTTITTKNEDVFCTNCKPKVVKIDGDKELFKIGKSIFTQFYDQCKSHENKIRTSSGNSNEELIKEMLIQISSELTTQMSITILNSDPIEIINMLKSVVFLAEHGLMFQDDNIVKEIVNTGTILNEISANILAAKQLNMKTHVCINNKLTFENINIEKKE